MSSLHISSLNSGSNGNCYYVGNNNEAVLIDIGISCKEVEKRLNSLKIPISRIKAIFISHEHTDHIKCVPVFAKKHQLPVFFSERTINKCNFNISNVSFFKHNEVVKIGSLTIKPFLKIHDAVHPHSFMVSENGINIGVFTDLGAVCENLIENFNQCHAAFLESNYCEDLLEKGNYPYYLKNRIRGGKGHLSNKQALDLFLNHKSNHLNTLILSHLSRENNSPEIVKNLFSPHTNEINLVVASRYETTDLFDITDKKHQIKRINILDIQENQLSLF